MAGQLVALGLCRQPGGLGAAGLLGGLARHLTGLKDREGVIRDRLRMSGRPAMRPQPSSGPEDGQSRTDV